MEDVFIIGVAATAFSKWAERSFRSLMEEVVEGALADAGLPDGQEVQQIAFGNCAMGAWGQGNIRGQTCLTPMIRAGRLAAYAPVVNVEGGCATGSLALRAAIQDVRAGAELSLAVGVEKLIFEDDPMKSFALFAGGIDQLDPDDWRGLYAAEAEAHGLEFRPHPMRVVFLDVHGLMAQRHMQRFGTTRAQIARVASKNHGHAVMNEKARYRFPVTPDQAMADRAVVGPLTRAMCSPLSDGAAAVLVCSAGRLARLPAEARARAVKIRAASLVGGRWRGLDEPDHTVEAARRAYEEAGLGPEAIDLAEVHDATSFCELKATEDLGFCAAGEGGAYAEGGATSLGGARPVNASGGLISKGHPLGATGLGMIEELVTQLRGEAGHRQVEGARIGLQHNAGGFLGLDTALCAVTILERTGQARPALEQGGAA